MLPFIIFLIAFSNATQCFNYSNCNSCHHWYDYNNALIALLASQPGVGYFEFRENFDQAVKIMRTFHNGTKSDDSLVFFFFGFCQPFEKMMHVTIQYLCCYAPNTYMQIFEVMSQVKWKPINLTFSKAICNFDNNKNKTVSVVILLDDSSSKQLMDLVDSFQQAMIDNGIPVHIPREKQEPFHSTLGVVNPGYPVEDLIDLLNSKIPVWSQNPITFNNFVSFIPPWVFNSTL